MRRKRRLTATEYKIAMVNVIRKQFSNFYTHVGTNNRWMVEQLGDFCEKYQVKIKDVEELIINIFRGFVK